MRGMLVEVLMPASVAVNRVSLCSLDSFGIHVEADRVLLDLDIVKEPVVLDVVTNVFDHIIEIGRRRRRG